MSRSKWKGPYIKTYFLKKNTHEKKNSNILIVPRNSKISPRFVGLVVSIYNGKKNIDLTVTENMLDHKFGEFSFTRASFTFRKKKQKK